MDPKEMKLTELENLSIVSAPFLRREWVIDPAQLRLPDDVIKNVTKIKLRGLAEVAQFESQIKAVEAKVFAELAEVL